MDEAPPKTNPRAWFVQLLDGKFPLPPEIWNLIDDWLYFIENAIICTECDEKTLDHPKCTACDEISDCCEHCDDTMSECGQCYNSICENCRLSCAVCGATLCSGSNCLESCVICEEVVCSEHLNECERCPDKVCDLCVSGNRCSVCNNVCCANHSFPCWSLFCDAITCEDCTSSNGWMECHWGCDFSACPAHGSGNLPCGNAACSSCVLDLLKTCDDCDSEYCKSCGHECSGCAACVDVCSRHKKRRKVEKE